MEYALTATKTKARAGSYYDRIARFYDLTFKLNGYGRSLDQYFATHPLPVSRGARIVVITDSELSPLSPLADEAIVVQTDTPSFFHTMAPAFAAVECLAALVAARHGPAALATLEASEDQLAAFDTYVIPQTKGRRRQ